jgi:hypothetical protein
MAGSSRDDLRVAIPVELASALHDHVRVIYTVHHNI